MGIVGVGGLRAMDGLGLEGGFFVCFLDLLLQTLRNFERCSRVTPCVACAAPGTRQLGTTSATGESSPRHTIEYRCA